MQATRDLYKLLGVSRGATRDEIRKAHRMLARELHPDANPADPSSEERFKDIQRAYEVLSDPEKRQEHDAKLRALRRGTQQATRESRWKDRGRAHHRGGPRRPLEQARRPREGSRRQA